MNGERYLGNTNTMEVHDLDNEKPQCQIDQIIAADHERPFQSVEAAKATGFDRGHYCLGESTR